MCVGKGCSNHICFVYSSIKKTSLNNIIDRVKEVAVKIFTKIKLKFDQLVESASLLFNQNSKSTSLIGKTGSFHHSSQLACDCRPCCRQPCSSSISYGA